MPMERLTLDPLREEGTTPSPATFEVSPEFKAATLNWFKIAGARTCICLSARFTCHVECMPDEQPFEA